MKKFFLTLLAVASVATHASAEVDTKKSLLKTSPVFVPGATALFFTNAPTFQLPKSGILSFEAHQVATNAGMITISTTTNTTYVFRYSNSGDRWTTSTGNQSSVVPLNGATPVVQVNAVTNTSLPVLVQLWYITNAAPTTTGGIWVSNTTGVVWSD